MANKRMFNAQIVDSDAFLDMPLSAQCLYFHLNMRADDDGFVGNPKTILRLINSTHDDLKLLIAKNFVLTFDSGVIVIKHWRMHNTLSKTRYKETAYLDEKGQLLLKENGAYSFTEGEPLDDRRYVEMFSRKIAIEEAENKWRTSGEQVENADKNRIDKNSIVNNIHSKKTLKDFKEDRPYKEDVITFFHNRGLTEEAEDFWQMLEKNEWKTISGEPIKEWKGIATNYIKQIKGLRDKKTEEEELLDAIYGTE